MVKPPKEDRNVFALKVLEKMPEIFTASDFKDKFRLMERSANTEPISFPFGTLYGDVEAVLTYLLRDEKIVDLGYGRYKHVAPAG